MNATTKKILFVGAVLLLLASSMFNLRSCKRKKIDYLQIRANIGQRRLDSLADVDITLRLRFDSIQKEFDRRDSEIRSLRIKADSIGRLAESYKRASRSLSLDIAKSRREEEVLTKNPIKRDDKALIESFKKKYGNK